jgi:hypothetical protein
VCGGSEPPRWMDLVDMVPPGGRLENGATAISSVVVEARVVRMEARALYRGSRNSSVLTSRSPASVRPKRCAHQRHSPGRADRAKGRSAIAATGANQPVLLQYVVAPLRRIRTSRSTQRHFVPPAALRRRGALYGLHRCCDSVLPLMATVTSASSTTLYSCP